MTLTTRFAPSPTGSLHIGVARTALFNWLYARHHEGRYLLRIEDTDHARSTDAAITSILDCLTWLGLAADEPPTFQSSQESRHVEVAMNLLAKGLAYRCYCTPSELEEMRIEAKASGRPTLYDGRWRDLDPAKAPPGVKPAIRFKAPRDGETVIQDQIQGDIRIENSQLDDMVLLRSDGTPTYMLAVVVDDHDTGVTHVIRGDDHLVNAARQSQLYLALEWPVPKFAHMPMIHGPDGGRLSKRHGAVGIDEYRKMGFLPAALRNYLLRLGWSHGNDEVISDVDAIKWFDLDAVSKSPARFDLAKLRSLNAHYLRAADVKSLVELLRPLFEAEGIFLCEDLIARLEAGIPSLKPRVSTLVELVNAARFYVMQRPISLNADATKLLNSDARIVLAMLIPNLADLEVWKEEAIESTMRAAAKTMGIKFGALAQPTRAALTGSITSPSLFEIMAILGRSEVINRLQDCTVDASKSTSQQPGAELNS
ncbi:MAG: glutamate--tRNA ligase [Alphaproteobacteria bacterium GM202ARS2]|nr:glutamate--tRNA ligase [Alphaproteobacteria bacterium GM202ARS2]